MISSGVVNRRIKDGHCEVEGPAISGVAAFRCKSEDMF